jgi:hypothetical protein
MYRSCFGHCRFFDQLSFEDQKGCITPPIFTKDLVRDKIWSEKIQDLLRKTRLGFTKELSNYKQLPRNNEENTDSLILEADVGTFEYL